MVFGLTFEKLLLIGLIAVLIVGPDRLPKYAESFAKMVRRAGEMLRDTKSRVRDEMGEDLGDVDWRKLDPRQYDPRRIIRDALFDDAPGAAVATAVAPAIEQVAVRPPMVRTEFSRQTPPPFDLEAT